MTVAGIREVHDSDCCDSCPYAPTCEEVRDFNESVLGMNPWGEEFEDFDDEAGWWPDDVDA